jgi:beta-mannosidase
MNPSKVFVLGMVAVIAGPGTPASIVSPESACLTGSGAPTTAEELKLRVRQLREYYRPYLRSLPDAFDARRRTDLAGVWRSRFEAEDVSRGPRPTAPPWHGVDFDDSEWEATTVPEWRYDKSAPFGTNPDQKARPFSHILWYRTTFASALPQPEKRVFLVFSGVAWEAEVWLNGTFLGRHNAYWEPFRFDVTSHLKERNVLAVRALSGAHLDELVPGWSVYGGWSVLPGAPAVSPRHVRDASKSVEGQRELFGFLNSCFRSGVGIHREVFLETTGTASVSELLVRGNPKTGEATIQVETATSDDQDLSFDVQLLPENFEGRSYGAVFTRPSKRGTQRNSLVVPMPEARPWNPSDPCLYRCRIRLRDGERTVDSKDALFGCRSFRLAGRKDPDLPEGMFVLNDQSIFVRGTNASPALNAFWYWRQEDKLLDVVLMMKAANFNAVRACEHVQFPEVREFFDRLGMMSEQDVCGVPAQVPVPAPEMKGMADLCARFARVCYNNPGVILLTTGGNEIEQNFDPSEIVASVVAADPERVVKPISGHMTDWGRAFDGQPPGYPALPKEYRDHVVDDFHNYAGWYLPGASLGKLSKRFPAGRLITVGEFGAEALDAYDTMRKYPAGLQPPPRTQDVLWGNAQVKKGEKLTEGMRGRPSKSLEEYIEASQTYQADVLAEQATSFRLSPGRIAGYFEFHFVEALPVEWPKSIVSFDLSPKKGFFEMAQVNQAVVPLFQLADQAKGMTLWVANDGRESYRQSRLDWSVEAEGKVLLHGGERVDVQPLDATRVRAIDLAPLPEGVPVVTVALVLSGAEGEPISRYRREVFLKAWR